MVTRSIGSIEILYVKEKYDGGLGLRKICFFNQALLAKQCWNLITSLKTLLAKLFEVLYCPNTYILDINSTSKIFPYWRGILWGRNLLKEGIGWRVGNRSQISLRNDNWIPGSSYFKLYLSNYIPNYVVTVADIIDKLSYE